MASTPSNEFPAEREASTASNEAGLVAQLHALLLSTTDVTQFLTDLSRLSVLLLPTVDMSCGITMRYDHRPITVASSDSRAERLDETQYERGEGPCLAALSDGRSRSVSDTGADDRWPHYLDIARQAGLRSSLSVAMVNDRQIFGALNLYAFDATDAFGAEVQRRYEIFAMQAASTLRLATRQANDAVTMTQFDEAINSRTTIDQAMGILIGRHGIPAERAFELLRAQSQSSHRKLRDVAADLVHEASGRPPSPGRPFGRPE